MSHERTDQRFDVPVKRTLIETYRAFRSYLERVAAAQGKTLHPDWYLDSPRDTPQLYTDQPHLLEPDA